MGQKVLRKSTFHLTAALVSSLVFLSPGNILIFYLHLFKHIFRFYHSLDDGLVCGGQSCHMWNSDTGSWDLSHTLTGLPREFHTSWTPGPDSGTYLMGGRNSPKSVQLVNSDGTVDPEMVSFLRYDTL